MSAAAARSLGRRALLHLMLPTAAIQGAVVYINRVSNGEVVALVPD